MPANNSRLGSKGYGIKFFEEENYIYTIHIGNYDSISYAYSALYDWAHLNGYCLDGPFIEKYYTDALITLDRVNMSQKLVLL